MNPYRTPAPRPVEVQHKPRPWYKTLYLKALIRIKGRWKQRFIRCEYCKLWVHRIPDGMHIDPEPFFHKMHCMAASPLERERHAKNYWFAVAPEPDEDFLGPLR